jgi:F-type H+-transporting ATPase subunit delta
MSTSPRTIRNYARVLLNSALEIKDLQGVKNRFTEIYSLNKTVPEFKLLLVSKRIEQSTKLKVLSSILKKTISPFEIEFIKVLMDRGDVSHLSAILTTFFSLADKESDTVNVTITSATKLDESIQTKIIDSIKSKKNIRITAKAMVNTDLIGGVKLRVGNTVIDGSVARRLEKLKTALSGA